MAFTDQQLRDYFDTYFTRNNRKETTGPQLNTGLKELLNYVNEEIIGVGGSTWATQNLNLDANRNHDALGFSMTIDNLRQHKQTSNSMPPIGEGSFSYKGFGSGETDIIAEWKNGSDNRSLYITGNGSVVNHGRFPGTTTNSAFGLNSLVSLNSGGAINNTSFGTDSLGLLNSGAYNSAFGSQALARAKGGQNSAFGANALELLISGNQNTAMGWGALRNNASGGYNTCFGVYSGSNVTTGSYNTMIGRTSGDVITTGSYNTVIGITNGISAGTTRNAIIADGDDNIALRKDENNNVIIGDETLLATTATDGFLHIPGGAGPPTGVPTLFTGKVPVYADTTNSKLYIYSGGSWVALN